MRGGGAKAASLPTTGRKYDGMPILSNNIPIFIFATMLQMWEECRTDKGLRGEKKFKKYQQGECLGRSNALI